MDNICHTYFKKRHDQECFHPIASGILIQKVIEK